MAQDSNPVRVLVVDDDEVILESCRRILEHRGYLVDVASDPFVGRDRALRGGYDLVLLDVRMPQLSGLEILAEVRERRSDLEVIVISGFAAVDDAVLAVKLGAFDYLPKPFTLDEFRGRVEAALAFLRQRRSAPPSATARPGWRLVGSSPAMAEVQQAIEELAPTERPVLITGESGTGKELAARELHRASARRDRPLVTLDCAALAPALTWGELFGLPSDGASGAMDTSPGLLEIADHGTLLLDSIECLTTEVQRGLIELLTNGTARLGDGATPRPLDVRIVAALTGDAAAPADRGALDPHLLQLLAGGAIRLPALRDRADDIPELLHHFLLEHGSPNARRPTRVAADAVAALQRYRWPGNVRELRALVEQLIVSVDRDTVELADLPDDIVRGEVGTPAALPGTAEALQALRRSGQARRYAEIERTFALEALRRNGWSVSRAAREVGMLRQDFASMLRKHRLRAAEIE